MIELALLVVLNRLANWGLGPIIVTRTVAADGDVLHGVLSDPGNQWRLAASFADVVTLQAAGDRCDAGCASRWGCACMQACRSSRATGRAC
jgi:hypothetical protein